LDHRTEIAVQTKGREPEKLSPEEQKDAVCFRCGLVMRVKAPVQRLSGERHQSHPDILKQGLRRFGAHQGEVIRLSSEIISPTCPAPHDSLSAAAPRCW
jgi:hypothetical protein